MDHQRLAYLLNRYADNTISSEEENEMLDFLDTGDPLATEAGEAFLLAHQHVTTDLAPYEGIAAKILAADRPAATTKVRRLGRLAAIAAAIVLLLGTSIYYWLHPHTPKTPVLTAAITPATNGAILTRGDGRRINLDSLQAGDLGPEDGTAVRLNKGQLAYEGGTATTHVVNNTIHTPNGKTFHLVLQDGTGVWLNAGSSITYPVAFHDKSREVSITGEVFFEVTSAANQPFKVNIDNKATVTVLGTKFNINAYRDESFIATTLIQGAVKVNEQVLRPGQQAVMSADGIVNLQEVNTDQAVAWRNGLFHFEKASIPAVMRQLSRWYDVSIRYEGNAPTRTFSGDVGRDLSLQDVLAILESMRIHYKIDNREIIITE